MSLSIEVLAPSCAPHGRSVHSRKYLNESPTTERHTAHQQRPAEVTIYYRYHPLRTQTLPVVRLYDFHDEGYYVVRRADRTPLPGPARRTRPEAAHAKIVSVARLPVRVLLELRRVTVTCLSSSAHNVHEEDHEIGRAH